MTQDRGELDELTVARARRGDRSAQRLLIERYQKMVFSYVARMLAARGRTALTDDLCQETFIRVLEALPRFVPGERARLSTWILTIATRLTLNELARKTPEVEHPDVERPDRAYEQRSQAERVRAAISELPVEQRTVLVMREYHDLDYAEIADVLSIDLGTVKSRLHRAREALRARLEEVHHG